MKRSNDNEGEVSVLADEDKVHDKETDPEDNEKLSTRAGGSSEDDDSDSSDSDSSDSDSDSSDEECELGDEEDRKEPGSEILYAQSKVNDEELDMNQLFDTNLFQFKNIWKLAQVLHTMQDAIKHAEENIESGIEAERRRR